MINFKIITRKIKAILSKKFRRDNLVFIAKRDDGLGERLRALLNAIALSKVYDADFKFIWSENLKDNRWNTTETAEKIFSSKFIHDHLIKNSKPPDCKGIDVFLSLKKDGWFFCDQVISKNAFKNSTKQYLRYEKELKNSFKKIGFSDSIKKSIELASQVKIGDKCVALHLRAGDLIYGNFKQNLSYNVKVISYPIALNIIENVTNKGCNVLIFGQDPDLIEKLAMRRKVIPASELTPGGLERVDVAFFDVALMARCQTIYAGDSGFAMLAGIIGDAEHIIPDKEISEREKVYLILNSLRSPLFAGEISNEQISFACKAALVSGVNILEEKECKELIGYGREADPENIAFDFFEAWNNYRKGEADNADIIISALIYNKKNRFDDFVMNNFGTPYQRVTFRKIFDPNVIVGFLDRPATEKLHKIITGNIKQ